MEHLLKLAELPAPKPLEIVLDTLADLAEGDWIKAELPAHPAPLYVMLRTMGYQWVSRVTESRLVEVVIWPAGAEAPETPG